MRIVKLKRNMKVLLIFVLTAVGIYSNSFSIYAELPSDINEHWAKNNIAEWIDKGYIKGYPDGSFKPYSGIKRAEFIAIVNRAFNFTNTIEISFVDVQSDAWYANDIAKAVAVGYITGYPDNTVKPENTISRQEVAVILVKIKGLKLDETVLNTFKDDIPEWSKKYIEVAVSNGIMKGYPDGTFGAEKDITRAEAVVATSNNFISDAMPTSSPAVVIGGSVGGSSGGQNNTTTPTPTPIPTPSSTPTPEQLANKIQLSTVGGSLVVDRAGSYDVTLVISNFDEINKQFGISATDLKNGSYKIAINVNEVEHTFEYEDDAKSFQVYFNSKTLITKESVNALNIYIKK